MQLKIAIRGDAQKFVEKISQRDNIAQEDVVCRALEDYRYLDMVRKEDGQVVLLRSNGCLQKLIF